MALTKVTYVNGTTVIGAENLNDIQDAIIALEEHAILDSDVDAAMSDSSENPVQNKVVTGKMKSTAELELSLRFADLTDRRSQAFRSFSTR